MLRAIHLSALALLIMTLCVHVDTQDMEAFSYCTACTEEQFCTAGRFYACPEHSIAQPGAAVVQDCVCMPGYNRTTSYQCDEGLPPYWYQNGQQRECSTHSRTTVVRADSERWCVCDEGFAGPGGPAGDCTECPRGTFNEGLNTTRCDACAPGSSNTHTRSQNRSDCQCGEGQHNEGSVGPAGGPCVCDAGWEGPAGACVKCAPGRYKQNAGDTATAGACMPCGAETYASQHGATACLQCGEHSQPNPDYTACLCNAGYTGDPTVIQPACAACPDNTFKADINQDSCAECMPNAWSPRTSPSIESCLCNKGYYQTGGFAKCTACEAGKYKDFNNNDGPEGGRCVQCPSNAGSPNTSVARQACVCDAGYQGQNGHDCTACVPGKFWREVEGGSVCVACAAGKYQAGGARTSCDTCVADSHSGPGTTSIQGCTCNAGFVPVGFEDDGTYYPNTPKCVACGVGRYASQGTCDVCAAGKFTAIEAQTSCQLCPADSTHNTPHTHCVCAKGFECREGSACTDGACVQCAADYYQPELIENPTCVKCPVNSQSPAASTAQTDCLCNVGYHATEYSCSACTAGTYSDRLDAADCTPCAYDSVSTEAQSGCSQCPDHSSTHGETRETCTCDKGYFRQDNVCVPCAEDTFKNTTGDQQCTGCPHNSASPPASTDILQCVCKPGSGKVSAACVECAIGYYKETTANEPCTKCGVNLSMAVVGSSNMSDCVCAPGAFLGVSGCEVCLISTYKPDYGNGSCTACKDNSVTLGPGTVFKSNCLCDPGYRDSGSDVCVICVPGTLNPDTNNNACTDCNINEYAYNSGQAYCDACPSYSSTNGHTGSALCDCVRGYERRWQDSAECEPCRAGTFKTDVLQRNCTRCASCASNEYVADSSDACSATHDVACTPCAAHSWIEAGQQHPGACFCLAGWESSPTSTSARTECHACQPGTFRVEDRDNSVGCAPCPHGTWTADLHSAQCQSWSGYCPEPDVSYVTREGNSTHDIACVACSECAAGSYAKRTCGMTFENNRADTECVPCEAGFVCAGGIRHPCRDNALSTPGSSDAAACKCLPGFYDSRGLCLRCEVDTFCVDGVRRNCPSYSITLHPGSESVLDCNCRMRYYRLDVTALSFQCRECTTDDWCFNNSAYNCSDDRMEIGDMAWHPANCTCVSGWYNTNFSTQEAPGRCSRCAADAYCEDGFMHDCPINTWTQGSTGTLEVGGCKCRPGLYLLHGVCMQCPWHHFCPGDDLAVACHANSQTENMGARSVEQCLCEQGFEPGGYNSYSSSNTSCSACASENGHEQDGFFKDWMGNTPCQPCARCTVAEDRVFLLEACTSKQNARCQTCSTCLNDTTFVGLTIAEACVDRVDAVCKPCSQCTPDEFQLQACSEIAHTVCRPVNKQPNCGVGCYRGGHTPLQQSSCSPCSLRVASAPFRFKTTGLRYNDAGSCQIECLGFATIRNTSDHSWGCETCETGNVLLKVLAVAVDSEMNQVNCSFKCRPGFVRAGGDCVLGVMGAHKLALEVVAFEKTLTGFVFDVHHSNHSRFVLVAGQVAPVHCDTRECCWAGLWRLSTLHQMGLIRHESCSASPALSTTQLSPSTVRFELPEARLESVASCAPVQGDVAGRVCVLSLSLLDVVHRRVQTQKLRLYVHRADSHVVHLRGQHTYVSLRKFSVDVQSLLLRNYSTVYSVTTRVQAGEWPVRITLRVRGMQLTVLTAAERHLCSRVTAAGVHNDSLDTELAANESRQLQSYWEGSPGVMHAFYTLHGEGVMDVAAVRNTHGQHPVCAAPEAAQVVGMGTVSAAVGLGSHVVAAMALVANNSISLPSVPGELGHMLTIFATASDMAVHTVALRGLLAVYVREQAALDLAGQTATYTVRGRLDFTREFRRWCNARANECVYEYLMPWHLYDNVRELKCAGSPPVDAAAQEWIRRSFGAVHDGGHVVGLCRQQQQLAETSHRSLVLLVHGMRFLSRATGGWGRDVVFGNKHSYSVFWPLLEFET